MEDSSSSEMKQNDENDIKGPLVFSCASCKTILGDSYSFLCSNEKAKTITLSSSSNIQRSANVFTSKAGHDIGSTYFVFSCNICQIVIGKYYLTTSKDLDNIREKFTFNADLLTTYELGKSKYGKIPDPDVVVVSFDSDEKSSDNANNSSSDKNLYEEILKMKHVIVDLAERVAILENKNSNNGVTAQAVLHQQSISSMLNVSWLNQNNSHDNLHNQIKRPRF